MVPDLHDQIRSILATSNHVLLTSHIRPDGDAVGGMIGLGLALKETGKDIQMVLADGVPSVFRYLEGSKLITHQPKPGSDLVIVLDSSDLIRTGNVLPPGVIPDLNIDHHISNLNFARINLVDPHAVATSAILAGSLPAWELKISQPVAEALLTGIVSDSIGFRTSNTRPDDLRLAAELMEKGVNLADLYNRALVQRSYESALLWGNGLTRIQKKGGVVWTSLTLADRKTTGYSGNDDADLVNLISSIEDAEVAIMFVELKDNRVKVSWRARPGLDVSPMAVSFGGGGHPAAAGAEISGTMEEVEPIILDATEVLLSNHDTNANSL